MSVKLQIFDCKVHRFYCKMRRFLQLNAVYFTVKSVGTLVPSYLTNFTTILRQCSDVGSIIQRHAERLCELAAITPFSG